MHGAVAATITDIWSLREIGVRQPVHDVAGASEADDDVVTSCIIAHDHTCIELTILEDLHVGELSVPSLSIVGIESPLDIVAEV